MSVAMTVCKVLQYKTWADRRTLDAVAQLDQRKHRVSLDFARQQLNHMICVEELFRARLLSTADPHAETNSDELPSLDELEHRLTKSNEWLQGYAATLDSTKLNERVRFRFVDGKSGTLTREEMLFHLVNHGTYHRGAIGHALDRAAVPRPADTYTVFIHAAEPERRGNP